MTRSNKSGPMIPTPRKSKLGVSIEELQAQVDAENAEEMAQAINDDDAETIEFTEKALGEIGGMAEVPVVSASNTGDDRDIGTPTEPAPAQTTAFPGLPPNSDLDRLTKAMESLAARQDSGSETNILIMQAMATIATAVQAMTTAQVEGSQKIADATRRAQRPSNEVPPMISAFNLRGDKDFPKPRLKCEFFLPWPAEWDGLTREECELLNLLIPGEFHIKRNDNTRVKLIVKADTRLDSDEPTRMLVHHDTAFNNDYHRMLPPLDIMLRQMLVGNPRTREACKAVLTMDEEAALILAGKLNDGTIPVKGGWVVSQGE